LFALNDDLADELDFIDVIAEENPKNYQIFHHRQKIVAEMSKRGTANFERELDFTEQLIDADQKNYHVWSYRYTLLPFRVWTDERQWLVKHFELSHSLEVAFTKRLIESDILNNSAWSHRYYTLFGNGATGEEKGEELVDSEVEFAKKIIRRLSSNAAPWNYLRGCPTHPLPC
jgi:protein farnesyltransferase/geranylgeranyltransferase type-1 subunit alpha